MSVKKGLFLCMEGPIVMKEGYKSVAMDYGDECATAIYWDSLDASVVCLQL